MKTCFDRIVTFVERPSTLVTAVANFTCDSITCVCGHRKTTFQPLFIAAANLSLSEM